MIILNRKELEHYKKKFRFKNRKRIKKIQPKKNNIKNIDQSPIPIIFRRLYHKVVYLFY